MYLIDQIACKGIVIGNARVVTTFSQIHELKPGEILIAPFTDVSWTPFFNLAAGIASDIGGMISHGAVVAREYGIPCVVCDFITLNLKSLRLI